MRYIREIEDMKKIKIIKKMRIEEIRKIKI